MTHNSREGIEEILAKKLHALETDWSDGCYIRGEDVDAICDYVHQELQKARQDWLREEIVKLEGMDEYIAVKDQSSHRYQIPSSKKEEWNTFCEIPEDDERSWDVPEWAERIDGMPVKSFKQTIIDRYQSELDQPTEITNPDAFERQGL